MNNFLVMFQKFYINIYTINSYNHNIYVCTYNIYDFIIYFESYFTTYKLINYTFIKTKSF